MQNKYISSGIMKSAISFRTGLIGLIAVWMLVFNYTAYAQPAVYTCEPFNANIPGYPTWTAGANFKTPTVDWTEAKITGGGVAPNDWEWVNAGANPAAANQNIAGFPAGTGFIRYINRTVAYPALSGAPNGDAAFIATRSLDWSGHTVYNAATDTIGISVWRDGTAGCAGVLDYIEVYVNTSPSLAGATLALTTGGANRIHRSSTQTPAGATANAWNRYQFVIPNDARFYSATGGTSSAYVIIAGYSAGGNNVFVDNINMPQWRTQMAVTGISVYVTQTADVGANTTDNLLMGLQVTTKGSISPRRLDGIAFNTIGSTAFIVDVVQPTGPKCWYTGGGQSFATTLGAVSIPKVNPSAATYTNATLYFGWLDGVAGCPTGLTPATVPFYPGNENFIWLAYDIAPGAIAGHNVAANLEQLYTGWSAPGAAGCFNDTVVTINGVQTPTSFANFTPYPSASAIRQVDQAYNIPTYSAGTSWPGGGYYNNDYVSAVQIFGDNSTSIDNYLHNTLCNSCVLVGGPYCQRHACHPPDYTQFPPANPGAFMNRGALQVTQGRGVRGATAPYVLKAECGTWFSANTIGVFIDWNKDGDFDDMYVGTTGTPAKDVAIYENYGSNQQTQCLSMGLPKLAWGANTSWNISVPQTTDVVTDQNNALQPPNNSTGPIITGNVRMRVREVYAAPGSAPGVIGVHPTQSGFTWGEVEDYTIQVLPDCPLPGSNVCKWVGATNDWNDPKNWCPALPTKHDIAFIAPGPAFMPVILDNTVAECRTLSIEPGARLGINATKNSSLKVYDDVEIGRGATGGTGSSIAVTGDFNQTLTIPGKSSVPPAGLALVPQTPLRTNAQSKTQIAYTATELATTYGWKAGDIIDQISIEVASVAPASAGSSNYQKFRIVAYFVNVPVTFPFPATPNTAIAVAAGSGPYSGNIVGGMKQIYPIISTDTNITFTVGAVGNNFPNLTGGTQGNGNYYTFNLKPNSLIWDGVSNLVLSFENNTPIGVAPLKNIVLYDEPNIAFVTLSVNGSGVSAGPITGFSIDGAGHYTGGTNATITATVSNQRPRLDFKWHRDYNVFPFTVCGDWINNNRNIRTTAYSINPVYNITGDSGFIAGKAKVIFDPTGRNTVNSPGLAVANATYYAGTPGQFLALDIDQDITSACTGGGNSTVFGTLEINKVSGTNKAVRQVSVFNPYLIGHYADTLILTNGELRLNRKEFTLRQPSPVCLTRTNGWLESEDNNGIVESKLKWKIGTDIGTHVIPWGDGTYYYPFTYTTVSGDHGDVQFSTYHTAVNNTILPQSPVLISQFNTWYSGGVLQTLPNAYDWTVDRYWYVNKSGTTGTASLKFGYDNPYEGTSLATYTAGQMKAQRNKNDTMWWQQKPGQSDLIVGNAVTVTVPTQLTDSINGIWVVTKIVGTQTPLPTEVINFNGKQVNERVKLWWDVQSESGVQNYAIERTTDLNFYEFVGNRNPVGPSNALLNYELWDNKPYNGTNYYRLASNNTDGSVKYYGPIAVNFGAKGMFEITNVYAADGSASINVNFTYDSNLPYSYMITDLLGNVVAQGNSQNALEGENSIVIPVSLSRGIYLITLMNSEKVVSQKLIY